MILDKTIQRGKLLLVLGVLAFSFVGAHAGFNQSTIDLAMSNKLASYDGNKSGASPSVVKSVHAFYYLTLVASLNPNATATNGKKVKDQAIAHFQHLVKGGNEPKCSNPLYGWSDGAVGLSLVLIKKTPALWNSLTPSEKEKADWLMKALAITGNWAFNDANDYKTGLGMEGNFGKRYNPNYAQGYMGVMIAFSIYFGADAGNAILKSFDYDRYMQQFRKYNWTNIITTWQKTGKKLMEQGGTDGMGGTGKGVKLPFKWNGYALNDLMGIFYSQSVTGSPSPMYSRTVINGIGPARILKGSSPVLGQRGMCLEFQTTDSKGLRSDALYALEGWMNNLITRATLKRLSKWGGVHAKIIEKLMMVGTIDLMYKLSKGYLGVSRWGSSTADDSPSGVAAAKGYYFHKDIWFNYVNGGKIREIRN